MADISREEVAAVAELAKLDISDEAMTLYTQQLRDILNYIEKLNEVDTSNIPPTASVLPLQNVLREDAVGPALTRDEVVANASDAQDTQFRVSPVLDND